MGAVRLGEVLLALQKEFITAVRGHDQAAWTIDVLDGNAGNTNQCMALGTLQPDGLPDVHPASHGPRDGFGLGCDDAGDAHDGVQGRACYSSRRDVPRERCLYSWIVH